MKRFLIRLTLFAFPFVLYLAVVGTLAYYTGEAFSYLDVIKRQQENHDLLYHPYDQRAIWGYKASYLENYHPEVVIVGSSRSQQYRSSFFNLNSDVVYNAGGTGWNLRQILPLLDHLNHEQAPRVLIIVMDQQWFRSQDTISLQDIDPSLDTRNVQRNIVGMANVTLALFNREVSITQMLNRYIPETHEPALGLTAIGFGYGYRYDGSRQVGQAIISNVEERRKRDMQTFKRRSGTFYSPATAIATGNVNYIDNLLKQASEQGIYVIAYFPPFVPEIYDEMMASGEYNYIPESSQALSDLFHSYGFSFFDFSNAAWVGGDWDELYDGIHSTELLQLRVHSEMVRLLPHILGDYADIETLEGWINQTEDPFSVTTDTP